MVHGINSSYELPSKMETWFIAIMKLYNLAFIKIICNLEDYILEHCQYTARGRLGEILCLIPTLQAISCELVDTIQFSKILGYAEVDALINEMLLNRGNYKQNTWCGFWCGTRCGSPCSTPCCTCMHSEISLSGSEINQVSYFG